jgi:hypothetical protein
MPWIEDADILDMVTSWGVEVVSGSEEGTGAVAERLIERELGFKIILDADAVDRLFDPGPRARITYVQFGQTWGDIDEIAVGCDYENEDGTVLVARRDYDLMTKEMPDGTIVNVGVTFKVGVPNIGQSIKVTGKQGIWADADVPADLVMAGKLIGAAYLAASSSAANDASDITETTTGQVRIKFGRSTSFKEWDGLTARGQSAINQAAMIIDAYAWTEIYG